MKKNIFPNNLLGTLRNTFLADFKLKATTLCIALPLCHNSLAQANDIETLTVIGTHISDTSSSEYIPNISISADEIAALTPNSFADILRGVPGIDITEQGGAAGLTFLSIRGSEANFVVILIDGVKVNDPTNSRGGAFDLGTIDPEMVESVNVYYGGYSTVQGSDALAGIVSIKTKKHSADKIGSVSLTAGSNRLTVGSIHLGSEVADIADFNLLASYQNNDDSHFGDAFHRSALNASLNSINNDTTLWNIGLFYVDGQGETFPEDSGGDRLAILPLQEVREFTQTNTNANIQHKLTDQFNLKFNAATTKREETSINPGIAGGKLDAVPAIDVDSHYKRTDFSLTANYAYSNKIQMALGASIADEDGGMDSTIDFGFPLPAVYTLSRHNEAVFAETTLAPLTELNITAGIRHDKADDISVTTHRVLSRYQISTAHSFTTQYSEGFKLPSFFAIGHPLVGNPDLKPELSENYEIGLDSAFNQNKLTTRFNLYQNTYKNLVDFDPETFTNVNRSKVRAKGAEFALNIKLNADLYAKANIGYAKLDTFDADIKLRRRPKLKGGFQLDYKPLNNVSLLSRITFNGSYYDSSVPTGTVEMAGFARVDLALRWKIDKSLTFAFSANNILDNSYEESVGFSNRGPVLTAKLTKSL